MSGVVHDARTFWQNRLHFGRHVARDDHYRLEARGECRLDGRGHQWLPTHEFEQLVRALHSSRGPGGEHDRRDLRSVHLEPA